MKTFLIFSALSILCTNIDARCLYVSPNGDDQASGTQKAPLKTIQTALNKADTTINEIILREGTYRLNNGLIINERMKPLTLRAHQGEKVKINGGVSLSVESICPIKDPDVLERVIESVRHDIREIDLSTHKNSLAPLHASGFGRPSLPAWSEIFINGEPLTLSRWPNDTMEPIGKIIVAGNDQDKKEKRLPVFQFNTDRPQRWSKAGTFWIRGYFAHGYADDMIPVQKIDQEKKTIHTGDFTTYQFMTGAPFRQWCAVNLLEEIDLPGEYMIDHQKGKAYFLPPKDEIKTIELSVLDAPLLSIIKSQGITIKNITFEITRGMGLYSEACKNTTVESCEFRNIGNVGLCVGQGTLSPQGYAHGEHSMESGGEKTHSIIGDVQGKIYADPVYDRQGGSKFTVRNSIFYQLGAGGINLSGGNRKTLEPANHLVENCRIAQFNRNEKSYRPGIWVDGVGTRISQCDIINAPSMAILFHGNDHIIELCYINNVCNEVDDQGAIYYGRDPSERGNIIRYNYFYELSPKHRVTATYHDDGACGSEVYGNIYLRAGSLPVLIGGGQDHNYHSNIFMEMPTAIHLDNRLQGWAQGMVAKGGIFESRLNLVNHTKPPYSTKYPHLATYWDDAPATPKRNTIHGNLFYKIHTIAHGATSLGEWWNNWTTNDDPGFIDITDPLKGFRKNAEVYKRIPGFPQIPFDKIGCKLKK